MQVEYGNPEARKNFGSFQELEETCLTRPKLEESRMRVEVPSPASRISVQMPLSVTSIKTTICPFLWVPLHFTYISVVAFIAAF